MNQARGSFGRTVLDGKIYVAGGSATGSALDSIERLDVRGGATSWELLSIKLTSAIANPVVSAFNES